uniref:Uncharacterized protein n=1 Tax=Plectus sambesii TaxID=2011161 RepID=A0A914VE91_9BILA
MRRSLSSDFSGAPPDVRRSSSCSMCVTLSRFTLRAALLRSVLPPLPLRSDVGSKERLRARPSDLIYRLRMLDSLASSLPPSQSGTSPPLSCPRGSSAPRGPPTLLPHFTITPLVFSLSVRPLNT